MWARGLSEPAIPVNLCDANMMWSGSTAPEEIEMYDGSDS